MAFDMNMLNLLSALPGGGMGDLSRIMGMLGPLAGGEKGGTPDLTQLLSLMQNLQPTQPAVDTEATEVENPCDSCMLPCPRSGLTLPTFQEAKQICGQWYHF